jgi:hypothetical protein
MWSKIFGETVVSTDQVPVSRTESPSTIRNVPFVANV